ncbi:hypothetical protein BHM03_00059844, partial [Ensete ventricosum]
TLPRGGHPYGRHRHPCWRQPLAGALQLTPTGYCPWERRQPPLQLAASASGAGLPCGLALAVGGRPCMGASCGWPPLLLAAFTAKTQEIVYLCIPYPDGEDEGGQASSSLAIYTRWISAAKLPQSDLTTLAQREGGE